MFEKKALTYAVVSLPDGYTKIDYQKKRTGRKVQSTVITRPREKYRKVSSEVLQSKVTA